MKKHLCPYINSQNKCTHKTFETNKKGKICIYNNPLKCRWYNEWLDKTKSLRTLPVHVLEDIRNTVELYKQRWAK